jgi:hypothetical protein
MKQTTAFHKAISFISASVQQTNEMSKPQRKFICWIFEKWILLPVRHNFLNSYRYGNGEYSEKSIRHQFSRKIPFLNWFECAFSGLKGKTCIAAFDPSYIKKAGKHTYGKGKFWSGKDSQVKEGLEISCLAMVDVTDRTAYSIEAVQTPAAMQGKLIEHYVEIIKSRLKFILPYTNYLAADGYFMKSSFIDPLTAEKLQIITKMRPDANLTYLYAGPQKKGRGRKKKYAGKVNVKKIDKRKWKQCYQDEGIDAYELIAWCVTLKRIVKVIYMEFKGTNRYAILLSTDTKLEGAKVIEYYQLRFQIEFLIRDAKQYTGLEECQARGEIKLYNHFNLSMMVVSLMKYQCRATLSQKENTPFSMRSIKTWFYNKFLTETIFSNLGLELNCNKIKRLYSQCLNIGAMAA